MCGVAICAAYMYNHQYERVCGVYSGHFFFLMQNGGVVLSLPVMIMWLFISVLSAVGNAGVPMGCNFLTLSLMSGVNAPIGIMGIILPIYTIIDMVEMAENVWSDSCVVLWWMQI